MMLQASKLVAYIEGAKVLREVDLDIRALICDHRRGNRQCGVCPSTESLPSF